jgi:hypothetical protein
MPAAITVYCENYGSVTLVSSLAFRQAQVRASTSWISTPAKAEEPGSPSTAIACPQHGCTELAAVGCIYSFDINRDFAAAPEKLHLESMSGPAAVTSSGGLALDFL